MDSIRRACAHRQPRVQSHANNRDALAFFNLPTSSELLDEVESLLPGHRGRLFPRTETPSMSRLYLLKALPPCNPGFRRRRSVPIAPASGR